MRTLGNLIWLVVSGLWMAIGYAVAGVICCILIITIPFGLASFRIANFALWPFGRMVVDRPDAGGASLVGNIIWLVFGGVWIAFGHLVLGALLCITIIGIPLGLAHFRLLPVSLMPLGKQIVPDPS